MNTIGIIGYGRFGKVLANILQKGFSLRIHDIEEKESTSNVNFRTLESVLEEKIKVADLLSKRRNRSVARPRQIAMALSKELTNHSLPEIGEAFGGRDHTTVLHACRKVKALREETHDIKEDYSNLIRTLSS